MGGSRPRLILIHSFLLDSLRGEGITEEKQTEKQNGAIRPCESESAISEHCNFTERSESAKEERADEEKHTGLKTGRLSGRMTDGRCKGETKEKK